ncbi:MAG: hypothetical protein M1820_009015 [Bogoriella megaspora]|nr:MAG: hypothetical protein M1820_009015 [Bogoriella megaspora]
MVLDPFSALSIATGVVQFLDFGKSLVTEGYNLYRSADGSSTKHTYLTNVAERLRSEADRLEQSIRVGERRYESEDEELGDEEVMQELAASCQKTAQEFITTMEDLKLDPEASGFAKGAQTLRQVLRSVKKERHLDNFERQLDVYRSELTLRLASNFRNRNSNLQVEIRNLRHAIETDKINREQRIGQLIEEMNKTRSIDRTNDTQNQPKLHVHLNEVAELAREQRIIASLHYRTMHVRHDEIQEAHAKTFNWLFETPSAVAEEDKQPVKFVDWLQCAGDGKDTYWITGKAGSGKSTIMKFLSTHPQTFAVLHKWIQGSERLITAGYYFWHAGTVLQKSQEGLMQSLLYEIFRQCPENIATICRERWELSLLTDQYQWTRRELLDTLLKLCSGGTMLSAKFCFFVDGLDEYSGRPLDIIEPLQKLACLPNVKICLSSRPWPAFETAFGSVEAHRLDLHKLTRDDIISYVESELKNNERYCQAETHDPTYKILIEKVTDKAKGVFLWVFLVVRSLLEGFENGDDTSFLLQRLDELPEELEDLFKRMLDNVDKRYEAKSAQILLMALAARGTFSVMTYAFLDEALSDPEKIRQRDASPFKEAQVAYRQGQTIRQIATTTKGLLEVSDSGNAISSYSRVRIDFLHRTVKDFLVEFQHDLVKRAGAKFQVYVALEHALLAELKHMPPFTHPFTAQSASVAEKILGYDRIAADLVHAIVYNAAQAEKANGQNPRDILAALHATTSGSRGGRAELAISNLRFGVPFSRLLDICVQYEHYTYVEQEIKRQPDLLHGMNRPLLCHALHIPMVSVKSVMVRMEMAKLLQKQGADLNEKLGMNQDKTVWSDFVGDVIEQDQARFPDDRDSDDLMTHYLELLRYLLHSGADPMVSQSRLKEQPVLYGRWVIPLPEASASLQRFRFDVLRSFIEAGADPNALYSDSTVWIHFLEHLVLAHEKPRQYFDFDIVQLFLVSGAALDVRIKAHISISKDRPKEYGSHALHGIIQACFPKDQATRLEEILKQQKAKLKPQPQPTRIKPVPHSQLRLFRRFWKVS